jgi:hypothetical protein
VWARLGGTCLWSQHVGGRQEDLKLQSSLCCIVKKLFLKIKRIVSVIQTTVIKKRKIPGFHIARLWIPESYYVTNKTFKYAKLDFCNEVINRSIVMENLSVHMFYVWGVYGCVGCVCVWGGWVCVCGVCGMGVCVVCMWCVCVCGVCVCCVCCVCVWCVCMWCVCVCVWCVFVVCVWMGVWSVCVCDMCGVCVGGIPGHMGSWAHLRRSSALWSGSPWLVLGVCEVTSSLYFPCGLCSVHVASFLTLMSVLFLQCPGNPYCEVHVRGVLSSLFIEVSQGQCGETNGKISRVLVR